MRTITKRLAFLLALLFLLLPPGTAWANAAEPPSITIITKSPPDDLGLTLFIGERPLETRRVDKTPETYYSFYYAGMHAEGDYVLQIERGDTTQLIPIEKPPGHYNNIYTLDVETGSLQEGRSLLRDAKYIALRVLLTLLLEALVFYLFGFRTRRSWIWFFSINLITQGLLNAYLTSRSLLGGYIILALVFGELLVFLAECISFLALVREKRKCIIVLYVILANTLSLFAGGWLISNLPI